MYKTGVHFYVNIKNLIDIIKEEADKDDDLKRTLHRLQTYFTGFTKLIDLYNGTVEKYTSGRAHVFFEVDVDGGNNESQIEKILKVVVACIYYNNKIFNELSKYKQYNYPDFKVHAGVDYGDFIEYEIEDNINECEFTTVGAVANNSAKIQSYANQNYIYILDRFHNELPSTLKEKFVELSDDEKKNIKGKIQNSKIYKAYYNNIFDSEVMEKLVEELEEVKTKVEDESKKLNIREISFEDVKVKLDFSGLSLSGKNKKFTGGVLCADIRGFTKLFNKSDNNLQDLFDVMKEIYSIMGQTVNDNDGIKVQYQGDRIVSVFHDFKDADDYIIRMLKTAFGLNKRIQDISDRKDIQEKLGNREISIGIGCSIGDIIATRLGARGEKDNIILGEVVLNADNCEDRYAEKNKTVINKEFRELIKDKKSESDAVEYEILNEIFSSISTTSFYETETTLTDFNNKVEEKKSEKIKNKMTNMLSATPVISSCSGERIEGAPRPWGEI